MLVQPIDCVPLIRLWAPGSGSLHLAIARPILAPFSFARQAPMTTEPLKGPLNLRGTLYQADRFLVTVRCQLMPEDVPVRGLALVPDTLDWLNLGVLTLELANGMRYEITPAKLERSPGAQSLLKFYVRVR
jgi:hypothetical protein